MPTPVVHRRQILVVDDSPLIRELARVGLEVLAGWDMSAAASGDEALRVAAADAPAAILLDVVMPGRDGPATMAALRDDAATCDIPVIFVTAKDLAGDRARLTALGAAGIIAKPFDVHALAGQVAGILGWDA